LAVDISIDPSWEQYVDSLVKTGRYETQQDVVTDGLKLVREREAKLQALRETIEASIARGGSHTSEEVMANVENRLAAWERKRSQ
jgi:antitoxin ParD1/3/4